MAKKTATPRISRAAPAHAPLLSDLAYRSKAHWGYSDAFMQACRAELSYAARDLRDPNAYFYVYEKDGRILGFYSLNKIDGKEYELGALFVEPEFIGRGVGKTLMQSAVSLARALGVRRLLIQSDPNAAPFYEAMGAVINGETESDSIPGRMLPSLVLNLKT